ACSGRSFRGYRLAVYFHCHAHDHQGWTVVTVVGELDLAAVPTVRSEVVAAVGRRRPPRLALDLVGVELIDSAGLGLVVGALKRVRAEKGDLVVVGTGRVAAALSLTGLDTLIPVVAELPSDGVVPPAVPAPPAA